MSLGGPSAVSMYSPHWQVYFWRRWRTMRKERSTTSTSSDSSYWSVISPTPTLRAGPIGLVEGVDDLHVGQLALRALAMARSRLLPAVARAVPGAPAVLRRRPE